MDDKGFIADLQVRGYSPQTAKRYRSALRLFERYLEQRHLKLRQVDFRVLADFRTHMTTLAGRNDPSSMAPGTIENRMAVLASFFSYLSMLNPRRKNPFAMFRMRSLRQQRLIDPRGKALDDATLEALLSGVVDPRDRAIFLLFLQSGLRLSELAQLDIDGITEEGEHNSTGNDEIVGGTGTVIGKGGKQRRFYFDREAARAIGTYLENRSDDCPALFVSQRKTRLSTRMIQQSLDTWCQKLGIPHAHIHALRHTFATKLANANIHEMVLQDLMGHARFDTTRGYFRLAEDTKARQYHAAMQFLRGPQVEGGN